MPTLIHIAQVMFIFAAALHLGSIGLVTLRTLIARRPAPAEGDVPGVTILRTVRGIENYVEETLGSSFHLTYPRYEVIFCCASAADDIVPIVQRLIERHPETPARLLIGDDRISVNPKLNNLVKGWAAARHDWIVMTDSNILLPPDYLERLLARWRRGTGLVCSPPLGSKPQGLWSEIECAFLNTFQARWQLTAAAIGLGFAQGKSMLWRRDILNRAGGIHALAAEAAEDAAATKVIRNAKLAIRLVPHPFEQPLGKRSWSEVWSRQIRWARLRRATFKLFFLPELLSGSFFPFCALAVLVLGGELPASSAALLALAWYGAEGMMALVLGWHLSPLSPLAWIVRDASIPIIWIAAVSGNRFEWRGNQMDIRHTDASGLEPVDERR